MEDIKTEFGKGLAYCCGLFLKHTERKRYSHDAAKENSEEAWSMWWYAAADHLMEIEIPDSLPQPLKGMAHDLSRLALEYRMPMYAKTDSGEKAHEAIQLAVDILFEIDSMIGVKPLKADYQ